MLVHMGQVCNAFLMNIYLDVRNPRGSGFWNEGYMSREREMESLVYEQPGNEVDGSYHSKVGSKQVRETNGEQRGMRKKGEQSKGDRYAMYCKYLANSYT